MKIGNITLSNQVILAPMAGVTDLPFRQLCKELGAGLVVSEMISANPQLLKTKKTQLRLRHENEISPIAVQIAGSDPQLMADCARFNVDNGAEIIDINMGCPAKKVCNKMAGSALLSDEKLVTEILQAVVAAVDVPVTLKIRTGPTPEQRNGPEIAKIAEESGIQMLTIHGRTRACKFQGKAEFDTIKQIKSERKIPIVANGDINSPQKAKYVLEYTNSDAIMIAQSALGKPWIFREVDYFLTKGKEMSKPTYEEIHNILFKHLTNLYHFYGEFMGVRIARKHVNWYCKASVNSTEFRIGFNQLTSSKSQLKTIREYFNHLIEGKALTA